MNSWLRVLTWGGGIYFGIGLLFVLAMFIKSGFRDIQLDDLWASIYTMLLWPFVLLTLLSMR